MSLDGRLDVAIDDAAVEFAFTVRNTGTEPVDLEFQSGKVADITVYENDTVVWRWSEDKMFTQALRAETLAPDESFTHEATWKAPSSGEYTAKASLEATNVLLVERTAFEV